jgi:hypothetical protein
MEAGSGQHRGWRSRGRGGQSLGRRQWGPSGWAAWPPFQRSNHLLSGEATGPSQSCWISTEGRRLLSRGIGGGRATVGHMVEQQRSGQGGHRQGQRTRHEMVLSDGSNKRNASGWVQAIFSSTLVSNLEGIFYFVEPFHCAPFEPNTLKVVRSRSVSHLKWYEAALFHHTLEPNVTVVFLFTLWHSPEKKMS